MLLPLSQNYQSNNSYLHFNEFLAFVTLDVIELLNCFELISQIDFLLFICKYFAEFQLLSCIEPTLTLTVQGQQFLLLIGSSLIVVYKEISSSCYEAMVISLYSNNNLYSCRWLKNILKEIWKQSKNFKVFVFIAINQLHILIKNSFCIRLAYDWDRITRLIKCS